MSSILDFFNQQKIQQDQFNYDKEARKLLQRGKVAANLQDFRWGGEQKVAPGGLLAGGMTSPLSTLATIATNIAGAKLMASTQKEREDLEKISNETFRDGMNMLKNEGASEKDAREKVQELVDPEKARTSFLLKATGRADGNMGPDTYNPAREVGGLEVNQAAYDQAQNQVAADRIRADSAKNLAASKPKVLGAAGTHISQSLGRDDIGVDRMTPQQMEQVASSGNRVGTEVGRDTNLEVHPTNTPFKYSFGLGSRETGPKTDVMGRDDIGVNRQTPQQMERAAFSAGGGRGSFGGPTAQDLKNYENRAGGGRGVQGGPTAQEVQAYQVPTSTSADPWAYGPEEAQVPQVGPVYDQAADDKYLRKSYETYVNDRAEQAKVLSRSATAAKDSRVDEARSILRRSGSKGQTVDNLFDEKTVASFFDDDRKNYIAVGDKIFNTRTQQFMGGAAPKERNIQSFKPGDMIPDGRGGWVEVPNGAAGGKSKKYAGSWDTAQGRVIAFDDGTTQLVGGVTPEVIEGRNADASKVAATEKMNRAANIIVGSIGQIIANGDHDAATGVRGKVGSAITGGTGLNTSAAAARSRIDNVSNQMIPLIFAQLQDDKVSANILQLAAMGRGAGALPARAGDQCREAWRAQLGHPARPGRPGPGSACCPGGGSIFSTPRPSTSRSRTRPGSRPSPRPKPWSGAPRKPCWTPTRTSKARGSSSWPSASR